MAYIRVASHEDNRLRFQSLSNKTNQRPLKRKRQHRLFRKVRKSE